MFLRALLALSWLTVCLCKMYDRVSDLSGLEYDFVITGGGTTGLVVANRLTENPDFSVLVLEAGVSNEGVLDSIIPFFVNNLLGITYTIGVLFLFFQRSTLLTAAQQTTRRRRGSA
ncbi:hypothetical protein DFH07DRAFT_361618 [Mycena maculata]|uniref:Glucose-methanol-choline oxidoreductase N-terminal domain-containing protein n=1 Tax=Mycena maculata TaxID=230809 RepID=A0AAD7HAY8_9AGAR|nr:hypothetical protein DFH07DRAFT_361618 [Mycena maculata]